MFLNTQGIPSLVMVDAPMTVETMKRRWIAAFSPQLSLSLKSPQYKPVLWDIFHSGKISCLAGENAQKAFDAVPKGRVYAFYEYDGGEEPALLLPEPQRLTADSLMDEYDLYLTDGSFTWTYCITHQPGCGPYFCRAAEK